MQIIQPLADNLVFLLMIHPFDKLIETSFYSILDKRPKRAKAYYFITADRRSKYPEFIVNDFGG